MNKQEMLKDYKNQEDKLLLAILLDKIEFTKTKKKNRMHRFFKLI